MILKSQGKLKVKKKKTVSIGSIATAPVDKGQCQHPENCSIRECIWSLVWSDQRGGWSRWRNRCGGLSAINVESPSQQYLKPKFL